MWLWAVSFCLQAMRAVDAHDCRLSSLTSVISFSTSLSPIRRRETTVGVGGSWFFPNKGGGPSVFLEARQWFS
jgi:hypothetical protein